MWAMSGGGFIIKPKCKLQGSSFARALMRRVPFECQFSLSTVKQPLNHYLKISVTANSINVLVKWAKLNKNMLLKYGKVWVNISNVKIYNIHV